MCGIFALLKKAETNKLDATKNFNLIKHRGPDQTAEVEINNSLIFGFHRLSINGLEHGMQPIVKHGMTLICNGEIYNHRELELKYGFTNITGSDCEAILDMINAVGISETLEQLLGVFAFVVYCSATEQLYVARDPIGIRPLFYTDEDEIITFSSEAKALHNPSKAQWFLPGCYAVINACYSPSSSSSFSFKMIPYFELRKSYSDSLTDDKDESIHERHIRNLLEDAVKIRVYNTERPIGVLLSGGLDSSAVASIANKVHLQRFGVPIKSFAIGVNADSSDIIASRLAAKWIGTDHHEVFFKVSDGIENYEKLIWHTETPDITTNRASLPMFLLMRWISENTDVRVILSGEGSDELFSGYLYNYYAPSPEELAEEAYRVTSEVYMFDVLRADRTASAFGIEIRTPFFDRRIVSYVLNTIPAELRIPTETRMEKMILRNALEGLLPDEIRLRRKEAFSDAVGYSWVDSLKAYADATITDEDLQRYTEVVPKPTTKEACMVRKIFEKHYGNAEIIPHFWLPRWSECGGDPSARVLPIYQKVVT